MYYFIGSLFPKKLERIIYENSSGHIDYAANTLQSSYIEGFKRNNSKLHIITLPCIGTYPKNYRRLSIPEENFATFTSITGKSLSFNTLPLIGLISQYFSLRRYLNKIKIMFQSNDTLVVYSLKSAYLLACYMIKKEIPYVKMCVIVPDLPQYMSESNGLFYRILKLLDSIIINKCLKKFDAFILLSDAMYNRLPIYEKPWLRIEGIYRQENSKYVDKDFNFVFAYTGTLDRRYGIENLLSSFTKMKGDTLRLWICGEGDFRNTIEEYTQKDHRIIYFGQLKHEQILILQKKATVLVNPRPSSGEYTKYSFPSKTMEYLGSGTPCMMYHLPAIPKEYLPHLYIINDTENGLYKKMEELYQTPRQELTIKGKNARDFILSKSPEKQVKKLINFLNVI